MTFLHVKMYNIPTRYIIFFRFYLHKKPTLRFKMHTHKFSQVCAGAQYGQKTVQKPAKPFLFFYIFHEIFGVIVELNFALAIAIFEGNIFSHENSEFDFSFKYPNIKLIEKFSSALILKTTCSNIDKCKSLCVFSDEGLRKNADRDYIWTILSFFRVFHIN